MNFIQSSKERWLLYGGLLLFTIGFGLALAIGTDDYQGSRTFEGTPFGLFIVMAVFIAPIWEELTFRGTYTKNRILRWISLIAIPVFLLISSAEWVAWLLLLVFYLLHFLSLCHGFSSLIWKFSLVVNAFLFGFVHYKMADFASVETAYLVLFQFAVGLLLIWVTLNFGIVKSMIFHCLYNFVPVLILFLYVQFPDQTVQRFENENIEVKWSRVPAIGEASSHYQAGKKLITVKNMEGAMIYDVLQTNPAAKRKINELQPWVRFNFQFTLRDTTGGVNLQDEVKRFLETEMVKKIEEDMY
ncbi:MAG: CPBP family intramembrane metalloprotease [Flavobacterium sp.]|nr:CPBP family intramembrane metalloprotease [Flavobacterium sp.]